MGDRRYEARKKMTYKELEGVAEGPLSTGVFNGNTRQNISVDAKSCGRVHEVVHKGKAMRNNTS